MLRAHLVSRDWREYPVIGYVGLLFPFSLFRQLYILLMERSLSSSGPPVGLPVFVPTGSAEGQRYVNVLHTEF